MEFDNPAFVDDPEDRFIDDDPVTIRSGDRVEREPTSVTVPSEAQPQSLQQELLQTAVDDYYNALAAKGLTPALGRDYSTFELVGGRLRLKAFPSFDLTNVRTGEPLALTTIAGHRGGGDVIRQGLGFVDWQRRPTLPAKAVSALQVADEKLGGAAAELEHIELRDLGQVATNASDAVQTVETSLTDAEIDDILGTIDEPPLNVRELRGLDQALQRVRGELTNNLAKLTELDAHIEREKEKLADAEDGGLEEHIRRRIADRLRDLHEERVARLEAASANGEALRSQINRMRETIRRILHEDTTLAERIRTLFREQGVTIASILTAIGMAISTLALALTGVGGSAPAPAPTPAPPAPAGGLKEWVKKHLEALGRVLARLAGKAAAALPGIIGSIVSWVLNLLSRTAGWLAEHVWALAVAVGGLLLVATQGWLQAIKRP